MARRLDKISLAEIVGLGDEMRAQNPKLERTKGEFARWFIRVEMDEIGPDGTIHRARPRIYLGDCKQVSRKEALVKRTEALRRVNRRAYVLKSQVRFSELADEWIANHVELPGNLAAPTQAKYKSHLTRHIRPHFDTLPLGLINTLAIDSFLAAKAKAGLSWATRMDLKNILSAMFEAARKWGFHEDRNPARDATAGRRRPKREKRKLSIEQTRALLDALPAGVAEMCMVTLFCTLRISEVLGLQWKHIEDGIVHVRQRVHRGNLDTVKSARARRDVPLGMLAPILERRRGAQDDFVFSGDDRDINRHYLRPAAKRLGLYYEGFGFHAFRREAITAIAARAGMAQAMRAAGHTSVDLTLLYTVEDRTAQEKAIREFQALLLKDDD
jgi:integrase